VAALPSGGSRLPTKAEVELDVILERLSRRGSMPSTTGVSAGANHTPAIVESTRKTVQIVYRPILAHRGHQPFRICNTLGQYQLATSSSP
jgi:hypothetical protein